MLPSCAQPRAQEAQPLTVIKVPLLKNRVRTFKRWCPLICYAVGRAKGVCIGRAQHGGDMRRRPEIEGSLTAVTVSVQAGVEPSIWCAHVPEHPFDSLFDNGAVEWFAVTQPSFGIKADELPVVVEHFLEMRNAPLAVDAVTGEAPADLVKNPPLSHGIQSRHDHVVDAACEAIVAGLGLRTANFEEEVQERT